ncbi:putative prophage protein [Salmonella enterica]|nr:putative prophage protein [Salmonella enterica]
MSGAYAHVGQLVGDLMQVQDCATVRRDPEQQLQLTSVIYLMTAQLDGVVERCNQQWLTGRQRMKKPLPPVLRAALYRRAVACAWLTLCERQHRYPQLTLDTLESAIAAELEDSTCASTARKKAARLPVHCWRINGSRPLKAAPSLSFLGWRNG